MADYQLKKSLGQHFLHDENMCRKIVNTLDAKPIERLLEVGPGAGAITKYLLKQKRWDYKMVEVDAEKVAYLKQHYGLAEAQLLHADVLHMAAPFEDPFYVVGNFPYNISTQIIFKVLEWGALVQGVTGMFQKEVAQRIAAPPGSKTYGITSVLVQAFYRVHYLFDVPPGCFTPPPKVMSGIIEMQPLAQPADFKSRKAFFTLVKAAFGQRRKTLRNAVKPLFDAQELQDEIFNKRAEQLSIEDFAKLSFRMNQ